MSVSGDSGKVELPKAEDISQEDSFVVVEQVLAEPDLAEIAKSILSDNSQIDEIVADSIACLEVNPPRIIEARDKLNKTLSMPMSAEQLEFVKKQLSRISQQWLFSGNYFPEDGICDSYLVQPGDQFVRLGKKFKVPYEALMRINNIEDPRRLRAGNTIKVVKGPFHCKIDRSSFTMDMFVQNTFVRSFPVGLGQSGKETPTGRWIVKPDGKLISPLWTDPDTGKTYRSGDPDYPLGARWIGMEGVEGDAKGRTGFAIHGTTKPEEVGTAGSRGCIRLSNEDAIFVYNLLAPGISQVIVVE
ncbi:L,D-transpeptidase family protein [Planctomycetota bacterium]